jgi:hypothetical protein
MSPGCPICREPEDPSDKTLKCTHAFHAACLDAWLVINNTCPVCRAQQPPRKRRNPFAAVDVLQARLRARVEALNGRGGDMQPVSMALVIEAIAQYLEDRRTHS